MLFLDKKHDPRRNAKLISEVTNNRVDSAAAIRETDGLFREYCINISDQLTKQPDPLSSAGLSFFKRLQTGLTRLVFTIRAKDIALTDDTYVDEEGNVYPGWKDQLDEEYKHLVNNSTFAHKHS